MDIVFVPNGLYVLAGLAMMAIARLRQWRWWLPIGMAISDSSDRKLLLGIVGRGLCVRFPLALGASLGVLALALIPYVAIAYFMVALADWLT